MKSARDLAKQAWDSKLKGKGDLDFEKSQAVHQNNLIAVAESIIKKGAGSAVTDQEKAMAEIVQADAQAKPKAAAAKVPEPAPKSASAAKPAEAPEAPKSK